MVPGEEEKTERYIWGLANNIQGNVTSTRTTRLQDTIRMANSLMDQKVRDIAIRDADSKRKWENEQEENHCQQQNKRQEVGRVYVARTSNKTGYTGILPLCDKCKLHHHGTCPVKCGNCKKVGHQARDCWTPTSVTCYGCGGKDTRKGATQDQRIRMETKKLVRTSTLLRLKESRDAETSTLGSEDEEYTMAVRDLKKFFRRRVNFVRKPYDDKKALRKVKDDKKENC
ncbi:reverse transcriptase domain-containing protein [Tanacetum coccineum]